METTANPQRDKDHPAPFAADFATRADWEARAAFLRRQVLVSQGLSPLPARTPLNPNITGAVEREEYIIENVSIESLPGHRVSGNLYRPKHHSGARPIVLHAHGHWPEGRLNWVGDEEVESQIASGAEVDRVAARSPLQAFSATLAQLGCVVFHYDMVGYADSQAIPHCEGFEDAQAIMRLQSVMGLQTWNSIRCLDYVLSLPNVDARRVAIMGASGGGTQSILLTAIDERITCSIPVVMISMNMQGGCICENAPLLRINTNNVELAALAAPRPLGGVGAKDWTHDFETRGLPELKHIYQLYRAEDRVEGKVFPFPHNFNLHSRRWCYEFLKRQFNLAAKSPVEERFRPAPVEALRVRLPAEETAKLADVNELRSGMTAKDAGFSPEVVRKALEAIVVADGVTPEKIDVDATHVVIALGEVKSKRLAEFKVVTPAPMRGIKIESHPSLVLAYNRSPLAQQVYETLGLIKSLRRSPGVRRITLLAGKDADAPGTLVALLAASSVDEAIIQRSKFDFDQITDVNDVCCLPGALKYGGMMAFRSLCDANIQFVDDLPAAIEKLVAER